MARAYQPVPARLPEGTADVQGGGEFTVARTFSGELYAAGGNVYGQSGPMDHGDPAGDHVPALTERGQVYPPPVRHQSAHRRRGGGRSRPAVGLDDGHQLGRTGWTLTRRRPGPGSSRVTVVAPQAVFDQPAQATNSVAVWTGDLNVVNLLNSNGTLNTILETAANSWQAPIPVVPGKSATVPGLAAIFGVPTDPTESTLFAIGLDKMLSVLTLDYFWLDPGAGPSGLHRSERDRLLPGPDQRADANETLVAYTPAQIKTHRRALRLSPALPLD